MKASRRAVRGALWRAVSGNNSGECVCVHGAESDGKPQNYPGSEVPLAGINDQCHNFVRRLFLREKSTSIVLTTALSTDQSCERAVLTVFLIRLRYFYINRCV